MRSSRLIFFLAGLLVLISLFSFACGDDDDDDNDDQPDDDTIDDDNDDTGDDDNDDTGDDDIVDDDTTDDDTVDDDTGDDDTGDDDTGDDDTVDEDTYVAPWPQSNLETQDYNETPEAGAMRIKVQEYDLWHEAHHQPYYGSTVGVNFTDDSYTTVIGYFDTGDSCIWTGTYLVSQAMRYYVTGDEQARQNVIKVVEALDGHLHVTGRTGFIARYRGPQDPLVMPTVCDPEDNCHVVDEGPYAGDFWKGNTSRDQYTGWFFGMCLAYDVLDERDEDVREMIRDDVTEVLDELIGNFWFIIDSDGQPTTAAPNVLPGQQLNWALVGYHMTGYERYKKVVQSWIKDNRRSILKLMNITFMNKYGQYYGNNLGHQNMYNILRLGEVYLGEDDYEFQRELFDSQTHRFVRLSHNAFFNAIYMSQGDYEPTDEDPYQDQLEQDLSEFRDAPNFRYYINPQTTELDPLSVFLDDLMEEWPWLAELIGDVDPQATEAFPVQLQCSTDFLWQRNPFRVGPCGSDNPASVQPGVDYLVAYWMAAYHKFIAKDM